MSENVPSSLLSYYTQAFSKEGDVVIGSSGLTSFQSRRSGGKRNLCSLWFNFTIIRAYLISLIETQLKLIKAKHVNMLPHVTEKSRKECCFQEQLDPGTQAMLLGLAVYLSSHSLCWLHSQQTFSACWKNGSGLNDSEVSWLSKTVQVSLGIQGGLVPGPPAGSKIEDIQVPYVKWCSIGI